MPIIYDLSNLPAATRELIETQYADLFSRFPDELLRLDDNAKTIKGQTQGVKTAVMYLSPADLSGFNMCANAELAGCKVACLGKAGRGVFENTQMARLRKTLYFQQYRDQFLAQLMREIARLSKLVAKQGFQLLVRLNGTSDIRWENYGIIQSYPEVQFYDYTKLSNRKNIPANYDLTFSYSGLPAFQPHVERAKASGARIAVVFRNPQTVAAMVASDETFQGLPVVNGDDTDIRHRDPQGVIVGLYAKGPAKKDKGGFVVDRPIRLT
jgi:hypothetical protein